MDLQTYKEIERGIEFVKSQLREADMFCNNCKTISLSNDVWNNFLSRSKTKFYRSIRKDINRELVMEHINKRFTI